MENEFEGTSLKGFSRRAQNEDFIDAMRSQIKKNFKYAIISIPIIFIVIIAIVAVISAKQGDKGNTLFLTAAFLFLVFVGIATGTFVSLIKNLGRLKKDSIDGVILKTRKWETVSDEKHTSHTKCYIIIKSDEGKKIKIKDKSALTFYPHVSEGDRVRFHPGYTFPIELYDKSKGNICVFCGNVTNTEADKCSRCKNPMLI
ncbi:MAG TPA: hypothetical protein DCO93_00945 [Clostridiales bacterium]|nr:hypothetical protein [Clostridiales bacterium]